MKDYKLLDIKEADYGCEERAEGVPLMCLLVLEEDGEESRKLFAEIPDSLATELALVNGQIISEEELSQMKMGKKPLNWDDISNRHYFETDIGRVCMSHNEFRDYSLNKI